MSQADIDDAIEDLYRQVQAGRISTEEFNARLERAQKGLTNLDKALEDSAKQFKTSMVQFGAGIYEGKLGQSQYNDALNSGADTIAKMSAYAGPLGIAFGALLKVITFGITEVNKMSDALYQSTTELSKAGVVGQEGMMGVAQSAREFGYGLDQLSNLTALLTANSTTLAQFGGTAVDGVKKFGALANEMKPLQEHFMLMGMTVDDINNGMAGYLRINAQYGQTQKMTTTELATASKDYLENMAKLSKLTGESAETLAKQQEHANTIDVWAGYIQSLEDSGQHKLAKIQQDTYNKIVASFGEGQADAYANQVSGIVGLTEGAQQQMMATNGKSIEIATAGAEMSADMRVQGLADAAFTTKSTQMFLSQLGGSRDIFGALNEQQKLWNMRGGRYIESVEKAAKQSGETSDAAMKAAVHERRMQMSSRDAMQDLVKSGIVPVTESMEYLSKMINHITHPLGDFDKDDNLITPEKKAADYKAAAGTVAKGQDIMVGLMKRGFTKEEAAAIAGNISAESSFDTGAVNSIGATGLMQWLGPRKEALMALAKKQGKDWSDMDVQLDFIKQEMKDGGTESANLQRAMAESHGDVKKAAILFGKYVERPSDSELASSAGKRAGVADALSNSDLENRGNAAAAIAAKDPRKITEDQSFMGKYGTDMLKAAGGAFSIFAGGIAAPFSAGASLGLSAVGYGLLASAVKSQVEKGLPAPAVSEAKDKVTSSDKRDTIDASKQADAVASAVAKAKGWADDDTSDQVDPQLQALCEIRDGIDNACRLIKSGNNTRTDVKHIINSNG